MEQILKENSKIKCELCDFEGISLSSHIRHKHNMSTAEYKNKFNVKKIQISYWRIGQTKENNDSVKRASESLKQNHIDHPEAWEASHDWMIGDGNPSKQPEVLAKLKNNISGMTEEARKIRSEKIRVAKTGKERLDMIGENNPAKRPEVRKKISDNNSMKRKEIVTKQIISRCAAPNFPEKYLFDLITSLFPNDYVLNPRGEVIRIGNKKPDIVCLDKKKLIEHFGRKWHPPEDEPNKIKFFKDFGYDCLIIWNEEFKDLELLKRKIIDFHTKI